LLALEFFGRCVVVFIVIIANYIIFIVEGELHGLPGGGARRLLADEVLVVLVIGVDELLALVFVLCSPARQDAERVIERHSDEDSRKSESENIVRIRLLLISLRGE
jgi:hypothetical protein